MICSPWPRVAFPASALESTLQPFSLSALPGGTWGQKVAYISSIAQYLPPSGIYRCRPWVRGFVPSVEAAAAVVPWEAVTLAAIPLVFHQSSASIFTFAVPSLSCVHLVTTCGRPWSAPPFICEIHHIPDLRTLYCNKKIMPHVSLGDFLSKAACRRLREYNTIQCIATVCSIDLHAGDGVYYYHRQMMRKIITAPFTHPVTTQAKAVPTCATVQY